MNWEREGDGGGFPLPGRLGVLVESSGVGLGQGWSCRAPVLSSSRAPTVGNGGDARRKKGGRVWGHRERGYLKEERRRGRRDLFS